MGKAQDLEKIDRIIKDGTIRLNTIKLNMDALIKEINILVPLEATLEENVKFLKKKDIVAMATEFRKAKEDLAKTRVRLILLKNDNDRAGKAFKETEVALERAKKDLAKLNKLGENNVVLGKFRRKDNG